MFKVSVKSGPPMGWGAEQLDGPVRMLLNSEKSPALCSLRVGPAIKSWMENVATAMVGEERSTGNTALNLFRESGNREKNTLIGKLLGGVDAPVVVDVDTLPMLDPQAGKARTYRRRQMHVIAFEVGTRRNGRVKAAEAFCTCVIIAFLPAALLC
jgi:hypothetical protein